ncbi:MAG TPA: spermidine/putrescine ABC transporter substrate-binding protein [Thermoanaerobaculia bacterium]|nr:spermidine/putrescine ABC transporter substrate-binding protein [Thermoanaerobaculia bacterium]
MAREPLVLRILLCTVVPLAACSEPADRGAPAETVRALNLYNWSEYIPQELLDEFAGRCRCPVTLATYESNEEMIAALEAGGVAKYDVVVPSDDAVPGMIDRGLLAPLRKDNLPNLVNVEPRFLDPAYDPGNLFTVPYLYGTTGLYVRGSVPEELRTWGLVFDPALGGRSFTLIDSKRELIALALLYLGLSPNSTVPTELARAGALIEEARPRSVGFYGGVEAKTLVVEGRVEVAMTYNGDALRGTEELPDSTYFVPREGATLWMDNLAVPARAPHRQVAEEFINFLLEPGAGARLANYNHTASPNRATLPAIEPADRANRVIYPSQAELARLHLLANLGSDLALYDQLWKRLRP